MERANVPIDLGPMPTPQLEGVEAGIASAAECGIPLEGGAASLAPMSGAAPETYVEMPERTPQVEIQEQIEYIQAAVRNGESAFVERKIISYYETLNNVSPRTDGEAPAYVRRHRDAILGAGRVVFPTVELVDLNGAYTLEASIRESSDSNELRKWITSYQTVAQRKSSNMLVVTIKIENHRNHRTRPSDIQASVVLGGVAVTSRPNTFSSRVWEALDVEDIKLQIRGDIESYYGDSVTYSYHIENNATFTGTGSSSVADEDSRLLRSSQEATRNDTWNRFLASRTGGDYETYLIELDLLIADEVIEANDRSIVALRQGQPTIVVDEEQRREFLMANYPFAGRR